MGAILSITSTFFIFQERISVLEERIASLQNTTAAPTPANTATAPTPLATPSPIKQNEVILSKHAEIFSFDDGSTSGWKPFEWDTGWVVFGKSGEIEVMDREFVLDGHNGPFLKYPLDLEAEGPNAYLTRNAIYKPVGNEVIGIVANIFYESDDEYSHEEIYAGFVVPYRVEGKELSNEDFMKKLIPNRWNTIIWSLYGPVWWGSEDKDEKWNEFKELFADEAAGLHAGRRLDRATIDKIGIQFFVSTEGDSKQFKGTAYIDNITLIYRHLP